MTFGFAVVAVFAVGLYLLPSFVAAGRRCKAAAGIVILNILLGWTFVGWVVALVWASVGEQKPAPPAEAAIDQKKGMVLGGVIAVCVVLVAVGAHVSKETNPIPKMPVTAQQGPAPVPATPALHRQVLVRTKPKVDACQQFAGTWKQEACETRLMPGAPIDQDCAQTHDPASYAYRACVAGSFD